MKAVIGDGCTGYGIKEMPSDIRKFLHHCIDAIPENELEEELLDYVYRLGKTTYEAEYCEQCGDTYREYTLEFKDKDK